MKYARCNNARVNEDFVRACKQEGMDIQFKYTVPGTPQENGHVEQKFITLFNMVHTVLIGGKFLSFLRNGSWADALNVEI